MKLSNLIDELIKIQNSESSDKNVRILLENDSIQLEAGVKEVFPVKNSIMLVNDNIHNSLNIELFDRYKDYPGISDLHELWKEGNEQELKELNFELKELLLSDTISQAVKFEKTFPSEISDWQRIATLYKYIKRRIR